MGVYFDILEKSFPKPPTFLSEYTTMLKRNDSHFLLYKCICWNFLSEMFDKLHYYIEIYVIQSMTFRNY